MDNTPRPVETPLEPAERQSQRDQAGQGMVEYAFILVLIAMAVIVALQVLGHTTNNLFSNVANGLNQ